MQKQELKLKDIYLMLKMDSPTEEHQEIKFL